LPLSQETFDKSDAFTKNSSSILDLQSKLPIVTKYLIVSKHLQLIIDLDNQADAIKSRKERAVLINSWTAENVVSFCICKNHEWAFNKIAESELALSLGPLTANDALYHRVRSWLYSMIFFLKEEYLLLFLNSWSLIEYSADLALTIVLLDDSEDREEDLKDDCPTFFTMLSQEEATKKSLLYLGYLDTKEYSASVGQEFQGGILNIKDFILLAISKVLECDKKLDQRNGLNLRQFFKDILEEKNWRGRKK
jgi:hypothetical protein